MSPIDRRPWWGDLPVGQKVVAFILPPLSVVIGVTGLVVSRPSGIKLVGIVALMVFSLWLSIDIVRDVLRKRGPKTGGPPLFERTMRGYRRKDVDDYIASVRQLNDTSKVDGALPAPDFAITFVGYSPRQVHAYLESMKVHRPEA
ncbi:hypothetical protein [Streptosporangium amethystogenes]|uniref:hypothetical protein n=1 Tax=Streptosporangium amethystogenes TaxID=2002 RepID=UPI0012FB5F76|nr:hypothetical protein [Streptosporangium amethystogenes]